MKNYLVTSLLFLCSGLSAIAQNNNSAFTQVLVSLDGQSGRVLAQSDITLKVNGKPQSLIGWSLVPPDQLQIAVLLDNNRFNKEFEEHLDSLRAFATSLPARAKVYIGYMTEEGIQTVQPFTWNHDRAASSFRRPSGVTERTPGPFTCLSTLVKTWPSDPLRPAARIVLLLSDGIDYRPDFATRAVEDAQRAGVAVFSIYPQGARLPISYNARYGLKFGDSPIDALDEVTGGTGGHAYYEPSGDQRPLAEYLDRFRNTLSSIYVASFVAPSAGTKLLWLKVETKLPGVKLSAPKAVLPGNIEVSNVQ